TVIYTFVIIIHLTKSLFRKSFKTSIYMSTPLELELRSTSKSCNCDKSILRLIGSTSVLSSRIGTGASTFVPYSASTVA
uniref:Uncharacterized protein n=1 Tax=Amphimedon queenslandica TaxID=400682 RepID=A0A1X7TYV4_AMPQE